jgi:hypothetical protein
MLRSTNGTLELPELRIDRNRSQRLYLHTDESASIYISHLQSDNHNNPRHLKRLAQVASNGHIRYSVVKHSQERELLMLRVFLNTNDGERRTVRMQVSSKQPTGDEPTEKWTFRKRIYDLRTSDSNEVLGLGMDAKMEALSHACYVTLDEDLAEGTYQLDFECDVASYFILYRTNPGKADRMEIYQDANEIDDE